MTERPLWTERPTARRRTWPQATALALIALAGGTGHAADNPSIVGSRAAAPGVSAALDPERSKMIPVGGGVELHMIDTGGASAEPPIVFIPGWSAGAHIWERQIAGFSGKHRIIAFDPRSQGESSKTNVGNTPEQRADDLHALLSHEHVDRPVLVGWSQAVQDIAAYVLKFGTNDLSGIVLVDAAVASGAKAIAERPQQSATQFRFFALYQTDQEAYLHGMFAAIISKPQPPGALARIMSTAMKTPSSIGIAMLVADMFGVDRTAALHKIACPTLIIAAGSSGELDLQKAEAEEIPGSRLVVISDSAHAIFLDQPAQFDATLADFLASIPMRTQTHAP